MIKLFHPNINVVAFAINNQTYTEDSSGFVYVNESDLKAALAAGFEYPRAIAAGTVNTPSVSTPVNRTSGGRAIPNLYPFAEYYFNENVNPLSPNVHPIRTNECFYNFDIVGKTLPLNVLVTGFGFSTSFGGSSSLSLTSQVFYTGDFIENGDGTSNYTFAFNVTTSKPTFDSTDRFVITAIIYVKSLAWFD